ncbi:hypothetical protein [Tsukamurella sp. NPDC003166]|uniref:hypothetical protein n=1 Tax=Tsukamurella sp. NPDC003166 TaxID=3154444 RepID=UPI0033B226B1
MRTIKRRILRVPVPAPPRPTAAEIRDRRRRGLPVVLGGQFDLGAEVAATCDPLAERVAAEPKPGAHAPLVRQVADAVHELVHAVVGLLAERDAQRQTRNLPVDRRGRSARLLCDLAERPAPPTITADQVRSGEWAQVLAQHAAPYADQLADLLAHAAPPGTLRGRLSASERVERALSEVDQAARNLTRALDRADDYRRQCGPKTPKTDPRRAELDALMKELNR